jgi:hypothetical protein
MYVPTMLARYSVALLLPVKYQAAEVIPKLSPLHLYWWADKTADFDTTQGHGLRDIIKKMLVGWTDRTRTPATGTSFEEFHGLWECLYRYINPGVLPSYFATHLSSLATIAHDKQDLPLEDMWPEGTKELETLAGNAFSEDQYFQHLIRPYYTQPGYDLILFEKLKDTKKTIVIIIECKYTYVGGTKSLSQQEISDKLEKRKAIWDPLLDEANKKKKKKYNTLEKVVRDCEIFHVICSFRRLASDVYPPEDNVIILNRAQLRKLYGPTFTELAQFRATQQGKGCFLLFLY